MTKIEWTHRPGTAPKTWNPVAGCSVISPGCTNCYAMDMAYRLQAMADAHERKTGEPGPLAHYCGLTEMSKGGPVWTGEVALAPEHKLDEPLRWKKPCTVFVNSMSDLFYEGMQDDWIDRVFAVMALCPQHTFIILTKRADRMRAYIGDRWAHKSAAAERIGYRILERMGEEEVAYPSHWAPTASALIHGPTPNVPGVMFPRPDVWPLPNVWLGVSVEDQPRAIRVLDLLATPAAVRLVSVEPMQGLVDLTRIDDGERDGTHLHFNALNGLAHDGHQSITGIFDQPDRKIDWVICGGESGPDASPMHPDWARSLCDQCDDAGTPFFFKQWGEWLPREPEGGPMWGSQASQSVDRHTLFPSDMENAPGWNDGLSFVAAGEDHAIFQKVGKHAAGRLLDGREWSEFPRTDSAGAS
ncbi:phage Gp37/Gp68 family protein [Nisaea sediminum]|uniref:phage Gp37/Gp68 family protein n=1 Tax=Nisaea sediminum TaxID=2775867 RepID=UPI0018689380|nr:phage Gp37/Gp68 family protein [Nisaea sediminum]